MLVFERVVVVNTDEHKIQGQQGEPWQQMEKLRKRKGNLSVIGCKTNKGTLFNSVQHANSLGPNQMQDGKSTKKS